MTLTGIRLRGFCRTHLGRSLFHTYRLPTYEQASSRQDRTDTQHSPSGTAEPDCIGSVRRCGEKSPSIIMLAKHEEPTDATNAHQLRPLQSSGPANRHQQQPRADYPRASGGFNPVFNLHSSANEASCG